MLNTEHDIVTRSNTLNKLTKRTRRNTLNKLTKRTRSNTLNKLTKRTRSNTLNKLTREYPAPNAVECIFLKINFLLLQFPDSN